MHHFNRSTMLARVGRHFSGRLDAARTEWLQRQGFRVVRYWNDDVLTDTDSVMESIYYAVNGDALLNHAPLPNPLP